MNDRNLKIEEITSELDRLMRLYKPADIAAFAAPLLTSYAEANSQTIQRLIEARIDAMPDDRYRAAAQILLVQESIRSNNLSARTKKAATEFGQAYDTFRRAGSDGGTPRDSVLKAVAAVIIDDPRPDRGINVVLIAALSGAALSILLVAGALIAFGGTSSVNADTTASPDTTALPETTPIPAEPTTAVEVTAPPDTTQLTETTADVALGEIDVSLQCISAFGDDWVAVPTGTTWACRAPFGTQTEPADLVAACKNQYGDRAKPVSTNPDSASWQCATPLTAADASDECSISAGQYDASQADDFADIASGFRERYELAGGADAVGCPQVMIHRWADGYLQELRQNDGGRAGLLSLRNQAPLLLEGSAWDAFNRIKGFTGGLVGFPLDEPVDADGHSALQLTGGGAIVSGLSESRSYRWMPSVVFERWLSIGGSDSCLGIPTTDPFTVGAQFKQDFEGGSMVLDPSIGALSVMGPACN